MLFDEQGVSESLPQEQMKHSIKERDVGAGLNRQVQVRLACAIGFSWIDNDDPHRWAGGASRLKSSIQDRVGKRRVCASDEYDLGVINVFVGAGRCISAERLLVSRHRRRHAQS